MKDNSKKLLTGGCLLAGLVLAIISDPLAVRETLALAAEKPSMWMTNYAPTELDTNRWAISVVPFTVEGVATKLTTNWIGHPMVSNNDPYWPSQGWLPDYQIGLRSDGAVVWRKTPSKGKANENSQ